jgi:AsmA protein
VKRALAIAGSVAVLLAILLVAIPPLVDLGAYKARFLPFAEHALGRKVDVGEVRLRVWPAPSIRLADLRVADNPAFSREPFFTARALSLRLKLAALLRGRLEVEEFILENPVFHLVKRADGAFNFGDLGKDKTAAAAKVRRAPRAPRFFPSRVRVEGGVMSLRAPGRNPLEIDGIELQLDDFAAGRPFRYRAAFKAPGLDPVAIAGAMIYDEAAATLSFRDSILKTEGVEFELAGVISGLSRTPEFNVSIANDGFEIKPLVERLKKRGTLARETAVSGVAGLRLRLRGRSNNILAELDARPKSVEIEEPGSFKGIVAGDVALAAPLAGDQPLLGRLHGAGRLTARDGALTNVDLVKQIEQVAGGAAVGKPQSGATTFRLVTSDFTLSGAVAELSRIGLESPMMDARGRGTLYVETRTVAITLQAALTPALSARLVSARRAAFSTDGRGRMLVPLRINGPVTRPSVNVEAPKVVARRSAPPPARTAAAGPSASARKNPSLFDRIFGTTH